MLDIQPVTVFVIIAVVLFIMAGSEVIIAGHKLGWHWFAVACLCLAWLAGGRLV